MRPDPNLALILYFLGIVVGGIFLFRVKPSKKRILFFLIFLGLLNGYILTISISGEPEKIHENIFMVGYGIAFCYVASFYRQILIKINFPLLLSLTIGYWLLIYANIYTIENNSISALIVFGMIGTLIFILSLLYKKPLKNWNIFLLYVWVTFIQATFTLLYYNRLEKDAVRYIPAPPQPGLTILPGGHLWVMEFTGHSLVGMFLFGVILITTYAIIASFIIAIFHFVFRYKNNITYYPLYENKYTKFFSNTFKPFQTEDFFEEKITLKNQWLFIFIIQVLIFAVLYNINQLFGFYTLAIFSILGSKLSTLYRKIFK